VTSDPDRAYATSSATRPSAESVDFSSRCGYNDLMDAQPRKTVGSRELKTRLGTYLRDVQAGATLVVTDRGRPVAELRPLEHGVGLESRLQELVSLGVLSGEVTASPLEPFEPIRSRGSSLSEAVLEDRENRF